MDLGVSDSSQLLCSESSQAPFLLQFVYACLREARQAAGLVCFEQAILFVEEFELVWDKMP
jgi:hypothetical protein